MEFIPIPDQDDNKFYYQGKYFDKQEDFWAYVKERGNEKITEETATYQCKILMKEFVLSMMVNDVEITNNCLRNLLSDTFLFFCARLHGVKINDR